MKIKYFSFLLLIVGSLLIGNSLLFYSKGFIGQFLLEKAWEERNLKNDYIRKKEYIDGNGIERIAKVIFNIN